MGGYAGVASRSRISLARFRDDGEVGRDSGMTGEKTGFGLPGAGCRFPEIRVIEIVRFVCRCLRFEVPDIAGAIPG